MVIAVDVKTEHHLYFKEDSIKDGTIALIVLQFGVSYQHICRMLLKTINLVSLNPKYDDIKVASFSDIKVMGKVVL